MKFSNNIAYFLLYSIVTIIFTVFSLISSLKKSIDSTTFIIELTNNFNMRVLLNFSVFLFFIFGKITQILIFGELTESEVENLFKSLPVFFINLLFNLIINDNNLILNFFLFNLSIAFKVFHVILINRIEVIIMKMLNNENKDLSNSFDIIKKYVFNLNFIINLLFILMDFFVAKHLVYDVFQGLNSVSCLLFGFLFAIHGVEALTYFCKFSLNLFELFYYRSNTNNSSNKNQDTKEDDDQEFFFENKTYFNKGIDIGSSFLKTVLYLYFIYLLTFYSKLSLPLSMLQGIYTSLKQTYLEVYQLFSFIKLTKHLNGFLIDANKNDLQSDDTICIICREDMYEPNEYFKKFNNRISKRKKPKKLPCDHILHIGCLKEWLERSNNCPICRRSVFEKRINKLPLKVIDSNSHDHNKVVPETEHTNRILNSNQINGDFSEYFPKFDDNEHSSENKKKHCLSMNLDLNNNKNLDHDLNRLKIHKSDTIPPGWVLAPITFSESNSNSNLFDSNSIKSNQEKKYKIHISNQLIVELKEK